VNRSFLSPREASVASPRPPRWRRFQSRITSGLSARWRWRDGRGVSTFLDHTSTGSLALGRDYLYVATDIIGAIPKAGGAPITLATGAEGPGSLTVADGNVLWVNLAMRALSETRPMQAMLTCAPGATVR
jgi:hypothetical protein